MQRCLPCHASISIHALREEGDLTAVCNVSSVTGFLSTPSARRATSTPNSVRCCCTNFYPRPPRGGRRSRLDAVPPAGIFLSTPSARRATPQRHGTGGHHPISIHALREEGDPGRDRRRRWSGHFYPRPPRGGRHAGEALRVGSVIISIHALREEGDLIRLLCMANSAIFLSTPSARRATAQLAALTAELEDFYPRPPRGGRPALPGDLLVLFFISIHALREEGDYFANSAKYQITLFLSTPSARRATLFLQHKRPPCRFLSTPSARRATGGAAAACKKKTNFYPRPPRGGRPSETLSPVAMHSYFYPRPPRGGRRGRQQALKLISYFYPRPPRGGRRTHPASSGRAGDFYPRPPRGGRPPCRHPADRPSNFYPRPPRGGRPAILVLCGGRQVFLSTPSARRETVRCGLLPPTRYDFYPRPPRGGRPVRASCTTFHGHFYPRPPRGGRRGSLTAFLSLFIFLSTPSARRAT